MSTKHAKAAEKFLENPVMADGTTRPFGWFVPRETR